MSSPLSANCPTAPLAHATAYANAHATPGDAPGGFDLLVIGSGPAGQKAALCAARLGRRVALVDERDMLGGVCTHRGTIPSKAIRESVLHLAAGADRHGALGRDAAAAVPDHITMDALLQRARDVARSEAQVIGRQMRHDGVTLIEGRARFEEAHTVRVTDGNGEEQLVTARHILIACGANPARPADVPFTPGRVIDSNEILALAELPRDLCVVGGGAIGTEYACMLAACGVRVTLVEGKTRLLDFLDEEISESLQYRLRELGVRLRLGEKVQQIDVAATHGRRHDARAEDPAQTKASAAGAHGIAGTGGIAGAGGVTATLCSGKRIVCDTLLYCVGRQGATDSLNLAAAGLSADERGRVVVNEAYQTAVAHIYAAGDVIGFPALAATSMQQGRRAAQHMFAPAELAAARDGAAGGGLDLFPYGIYTIPEISMLGRTERQLTDARVPYEVGVARYKEIARGQLLGDAHGLMKLLFHAETHRLLGVHAIGTGATELIHIGQVAMSAGLPIDYFAEAVFNYPTLAECYTVAALDGLGRCRVSIASSAPPASDGSAVSKAA